MEVPSVARSVSPALPYSEVYLVHSAGQGHRSLKALLAFYDVPAERWVHLRTTNPIQSAFSTVELRTRMNRGAGGPASAIAMVGKLVESAQTRWRAITGAHPVPLVRAGAKSDSGVLVERDTVAA